MTIDLLILIQMVIAALSGSLLYIIIGIIPGTDETAVLAPLSIILVALGVAPLVVLTFFIAAMTTLNTTASIPTALTTIPGGVMATPLIPSSQYLKEKGQSTNSMRKMTIGSLIGTLVAIPMSLLIFLIVYLLEKAFGFSLSKSISNHSGYVYLFGAIFLSLLSKKKIISLVSILPLSIIIFYIQKGFNVTATPFFLSITSGPLVASIVFLIFPKYLKNVEVKGNKEIVIDDNEEVLNAFKIVDKRELRTSILASMLASLTFFLSPVAMTLLIGDGLTDNVSNKKDKAFLKVTTMNSISNSSYLVGVIVSLIIFKFPISPAALGPGGVIFEEGSIFYDLSFSATMIAVLIGSLLAISLTVFLSLKYARKLTEIIFKYVSQESVIILLLTLAVVLIYLDTFTISSVLIMLLFATFSGILNNYGVTFGIQFMAFYASAFIASILGL